MLPDLVLKKFIIYSEIIFGIRYKCKDNNKAAFYQI